MKVIGAKEPRHKFHGKYKLAGLRTFDKAAKRPSPFDPDKSIKKLYRKSAAHKHDRQS